MSYDYFEKLVIIFKTIASFILRNQKIPEGRTVFYDASLVTMLDIMAFLNKLNHTMNGLKVPYDIFHLNDLSEYLDVRVDYIMWLSDHDVSYVFFRSLSKVIY